MWQASGVQINFGRCLGLYRLYFTNPVSILVFPYFCSYSTLDIACNLCVEEVFGPLMNELEAEPDMADSIYHLCMWMLSQIEAGAGCAAWSEVLQQGLLYLAQFYLSGYVASATCLFKLKNS